MIIKLLVFPLNCTPSDFENLPNHIFSYSCSKCLTKCFDNEAIGNYAKLNCGIKTGNNELFVRLWYEVSNNNISWKDSSHLHIISGKHKWFLYCQGGGFRKWYGSLSNVVNLEQDARDIKRLVKKTTYRLGDQSKYHLTGLVWPLIGTDKFSSRFLPANVLPDIASDPLPESLLPPELPWPLILHLLARMPKRLDLIWMRLS